MEHQYLFGKDLKTFDCVTSGDTCTAVIDGNNITFTYRLTGPNSLHMTGDFGSRTAYFAKDKDILHIFIDGEKFILKVPDNSSAYEDDSAVAGGGLVETPMPGTIIKFLVAEGDSVEEQQPLVIVEAMKMENEIRAPIAGTVKSLNFKAGDPVDVGQSIIDIEPLEE